MPPYGPSTLRCLGLPSSLFDALRGSTIAQASFQTTRLHPNTPGGAVALTWRQMGAVLMTKLHTVIVVILAVGLGYLLVRRPQDRPRAAGAGTAGAGPETTSTALAAETR